jgi:16S rRNA (guanine966-N2)-methyltransferase
VRVIAGIAGGLHLEVPRRGVRPTMDRVKGAIFSSLGERIIGARILDLFAGAGGLGIEALSRGAVSAIFVESNRSSARAIERNLTTAKLEGKVRSQDVFEFLKHTTQQFDIIFSDPPYEPVSSGESFTNLLLNNEAIPRVLAGNGAFVLEKRPGEPLPPHPNWAISRARKYGATEVLFLEKAK